MAIATLNSNGRSILKITYMLQLASAALSAPADTTAANVNLFILNANGDSSKITLAAAAGFSPSPVVSPLTTEGNSEVQAIDISDGGTFQMLEQSPTEYKALKTAYNGLKCRLVGLIGDPDLMVDATTQVVTVAAGDQFFYSHDVTVKFVNDLVDGAEGKQLITFSKQVAGSEDTYKDWDVVTA